MAKNKHTPKIEIVYIGYRLRLKGPKRLHRAIALVASCGYCFQDESREGNDTIGRYDSAAFSTLAEFGGISMELPGGGGRRVYVRGSQVA